MIIYGVALLAICTLAGVIVGDLLGVLLGVKSNVGGVGIAMILLICARLWMQKRGGMTKDCEMGVGFWGAMYIPVVVAMAAQQNVVTALHDDLEHGARREVAVGAGHQAAFQLRAAARVRDWAPRARPRARD